MSATKSARTKIEINELAQLHYLAEYEQKFMAFHIWEVRDKIQEIKESCGLQGNWILSADFKWLIKEE